MTMKHNADFSIRVYVGTYGKYSAGSIFGKWFTIDAVTDMDELRQEWADLHADEADPEYMFQDWELPDVFRSLVGESHMPDDLPEIIAELERSGIDQDVLNAYVTLFGWPGDVGDVPELIDAVQDTYQGEFSPDREFAEYMAEQLGDVPEAGRAPWPLYCIDWDYAARELMYDYAAHNGHYFRSV